MREGAVLPKAVLRIKGFTWKVALTESAGD